MIPVNEGNQGERLDTLFRAYRDACIPPEPSANFMPELWRRIESRQTFSFFFGRVARGFVTASMAATVAMAFYLSVPRNAGLPYSSTYVDVLAASHNADSPDLYETAGYELTSMPDEI
jgi:hypothetical protein